MNRRDLLNNETVGKAMAVSLYGAAVDASTSSQDGTRKSILSRSRGRPGDPGWPSGATWARLKRDVGGRLLELKSPFTHCGTKTVGAACSETLKHLEIPFYLGDKPELRQTSGWLDAWSSQPSAYAVAAVDFAHRHNLRLVIKGGEGHSYQGTSNAPDSLLVWIRNMNDIALHDAFIGEGCARSVLPQPAVTLGAGAMWIDVYNAVTNRGGRYVQGGGCSGAICRRRTVEPTRQSRYTWRSL